MWTAPAVQGESGGGSRSVQSCVRPVGAARMTAGLDEVRGSDPKSLTRRLDPEGFSNPRCDRFAITSQHPCTFGTAWPMRWWPTRPVLRRPACV
jgi:hypothetical protein